MNGRRYPDINCELAGAHSRELVQNLLMRELDVALTFKLPDHPECAKARALAHGVLVALAPGSYWADESEGLPLALNELADAPLIGLSGADPLFARLDNYLQAVEPPPRHQHCGADLFTGAGDGGVGCGAGGDRSVYRGGCIALEYRDPALEPGAADYAVCADPGR